MAILFMQFYLMNYAYVWYIYLKEVKLWDRQSLNKIDENLKKQFDELCGEFGIGAEAAINIFAQTFVREQKMPSEIFAENILQREALNAFNNMREQAIKAGAVGMSLDEINEEIRLALGFGINLFE